MDTKQIYINFIKTMPIWELCEKFRAELELTKYEIKNYLERLDSRDARVAKLPKINFSKGWDDKGPQLEPTCDNLDIVKSYRKIGDQYQCCDKKPPKKVNEDPFRSASVLMLEEKPSAGEKVYAMITPGKPWVECTIRYVNRKRFMKNGCSTFATTFNLILPDEGRAQKDKYTVARIQDHKDNLRASKRVIAGLMPGIIGEEPDQNNKSRYLVFMDDGSAKYFKPDQVYPIFGQTEFPWMDCDKTGKRDSLNKVYLQQYFNTYPKKHILQASVGDILSVYRNGTLVEATLIGIDCNSIRVLYRDYIEESIYRGSLRLIKNKHVTAMMLKKVKNLDNFDTSLMMHIYLYKEAGRRALDEDIYDGLEGFNRQLTISKNHNTARKSTAKRSYSPKRIKVDLDGRRVEEVRERIENLEDDDRSHVCSSSCLNVPGKTTELSVNDIIDEFRDVSDLRVPALLGWQRKLNRVPVKGGKTRVTVVYEAPCGKNFQQPHNVRKYMQKVGSKLDIDYFCFDRNVDISKPYGSLNAYYYKKNIAVDPKTGSPLENKHISLVNQISEERLPEDFEYRNESFPHPLLKARGFNFNHEFKSGCDCDDDCSSKASCACHLLTEQMYKEGAISRGVIDRKCQYNHKRLDQQVTTGIFECNSFCKCSLRCSNRVVQNGIKYRLQVQKTLAKGWGVVTLDDIPPGAFICTYSAELLDDADKYGDSDMYYADLDYITENERIKIRDDEKSDEGVDTENDDVIIEEPADNSRRPRFKKIHKLLKSHDFTLDARMQGNIGRFFNHSCDPNSFVQNVFIETHDLRFPVVAFFANKKPIKAMSEINWNYSYKIGSIPGRRIDCHCGAPNCQGRIL